VTHPVAAVVALALAAALVLGAAAGAAVLVLAVLLVQGLVVATWHRALDVPGALGGALVAGAACVGADVLVLAEEGERPLAAVPPVLALAVLGALAHQVLRRDRRPRLNASMSATVTVAAFGGLTCAFLAVEDSEGGAPLVAVAAVAAGLVAAGTVVRRRLRMPSRADAAVVGLAVAAALPVAPVTDLDLPTVLALGLGAAVAAWVGAVFVSRAPGPEAALAAGLPHALAAPVAYVLGRLLVG
jgi:hypothetical protein